MTVHFEDLRLLVAAKKLQFTDDQLNWLLAHIGDLNPEIRDTTVYTLLSRGLTEDSFTTQQKQTILRTVLTQNGLFKNIEQPANDDVFCRTFTALLIAEILASDSRNPWLTEPQRQLFFNDALSYLPQELDQRGFVANKGWAHGIAHGSDLLDAAWCHPNFSAPQSQQALLVIASVFKRQSGFFIADEEPRLAIPIVHAMASQHLSENTLTNWLQATNNHLWTDFSFDDLAADARLHNWLSFLHHLYFLLPETSINRPIITHLSTQYYQRYGYQKPTTTLAKNPLV